MTPTRPKALRIPDELWEAALAKAQAEGKTLTQVVVAALTRYVSR
jgi:predicted HicB family RNase H-like nuclease